MRNIVSKCGRDPLGQGILRLAARTKWRLLAEKPHEFEWYNHPDMVQSLMSARDLMSTEMVVESGLMAKGLSEFVGVQSVDEWLHFLCQLRCNIVQLSDEELRSFGIGLFPLAAIINHSCNPNVAFIFIEQQLRVRTLRDIAPEEELFVGYCDLSWPRLLRHKELQHHYFFTCECTRCCDENDPVEQFSRPICDQCGVICTQDKLCSNCGPKAKEEQHALIACEGIQHGSVEGQVELVLEQCLKVLQPQHHAILGAREALMAQALEASNFQSALAHAASLVASYNEVLIGHHPLRSIKLAQLAKLQIHLGLIDAASETLACASHEAEITHGANSDLSTEIFSLGQSLHTARQMKIDIPQ